MDRPSISPSCSLTFCIPTYNRAEIVHDLVTRLLQCPTQDIEVVVLDNGSTDATIERLGSIGDSRLTVRSNGTNRGVLFNVVNVLLQGRGEHCVLLLDKDSVDPEQIPAFTAFLRQHQPAFGFCEYHSAPGRPPEISTAGIEALRKLGYSCHHPTGYFFDAQRLKQLDVAPCLDFERAGHFPFEFLQAELALKGNGAVYHAPVFTPEAPKAAAATKSFGTHAMKEDAFFSPIGRLKTAVNFSRHILTLPIPADARRKLIKDRFAQGLLMATLGYRDLLGNTELCEHYHLPPRQMGRLELLKTSFAFYRGYVNSFLRERQPQELGLSGITIAWDFVARILKSLKRHLTRRFT